MMLNMRKCLSRLVFLALVVSAFAGLGEEPVPGVFLNVFSNAHTYAVAHKVPLITVVGFASCQNCTTLKAYLESDAGRKWLSDKQYLFVEKHLTYDEFIRCYNASGQLPDDDNWLAERWADGRLVYEDGVPKSVGSAKIGHTPFVKVYWQKSGGTEESSVFSGTTTDAPLRDLPGSLLDRFTNHVESVVGAYVPRPPVPAAGFAFTGTFSDRLEATPGKTTHLAVPLAMEVAETPVTNVLRASWPRDIAGDFSTNVVFEAGETAKTVRLDFPGGRALEEGDVVTLRILDADGEERAVTEVKVFAGENSPKNPLWIGDRTEETLGWGEWTMDLKVATNKVANFAGDAYTLILVGGSTWCPDCYSTDHFFIETGAFRDWSTSRNVACVAVDVPKMDSDYPSLLSYRSSRASDRYCTCNWGLHTTNELGEVTGIYTNEDMRIQSGVAFLSRNMVDADAAAAVAARNHDLLYKDTLHGGLCRPENAAGGTTPGVYSFKTGIPCMILMDKTGRIAGRFYQFNDTSPSSFEHTAAFIRRLDELIGQCADATEEDNEHWMTADAHTVSSKGSKDSTLSSMDISDTWRLADSPDRWSRRTFTVAGGGYAGDSNVTVRLIRVKDGVSANLAEATGVLKDGIALAADVAYAAGAVDYLQLAAVQSRGFGTDETFAIDRTTDSVVNYTLTADYAYDAGVVAFATNYMEVSESAGTVNLKVRRRGGASGSVTAEVYVVESEAQPARYAFTPVALTWADGETGEKTVPLTIVDDSVYDGNERIVFGFRGREGRMTVLIRENDKAQVGKLVIAESSPAFDEEMTLTAAVGSTVRVGIARTDGSVGRVSADIQCTGGTLSSNRVAWVSKDRAAVKYVELTVPASDCALSVVSDDIYVEPFRSVLYVRTVAADAPGFAVSRLELDVLRYVAFSNDEVTVSNAGGDVSLVLVSGRRAPGLDVSVRGERLVVCGHATLAGTFDGIYQAVRNAGTAEEAKGGTIRIVQTVADTPAELNPAVAKSRTFRDVSLIDGASRSLSGRMTLTVSANGRLSAKLAEGSGTLAYASDGWSACGADGTLTAELQAVSGGERLTVKAYADGRVECVRHQGAGVTEIAIPTAVWSQANSASDWKGVYTVAFMDATVLSGERVPSGHPWISMKMSGDGACASGAFTYAGCLPNGRAISGVATLSFRDGDPCGFLPIDCALAEDRFTALLQVLPNAGTGSPEAHRAVLPHPDADCHWIHADGRSDCEVSYKAYGSYYDPDEDFRDCLCNSLEMDPQTVVVKLDFEADTQSLGDSVRYGAAGAFEPVRFTAAGGATFLPDVDCSDRLMISFNPRTGVFSGKLRLPFADYIPTAKFRGIALPGWQGCHCHLRVPDDKDFFMFGSCWYQEDVRKGCSVRFKTNY